MDHRPLPALWMGAGVILSLLVPVVGAVAVSALLGAAAIEHLPLHSLIESACGLMALALAGILLAERRREGGPAEGSWMASALIGMGVLDLFHASVMPGANFVWLRSTATCVGGLLIAGVWIPRLPGRLADWLPTWIGLGSVAWGILSCLIPAQIPVMVTPDGRFTAIADGLNVVGGVGFFLAAAFFGLRFYRSGMRRDWFFAVYANLLGASGILFELSRLWEAGWWWWHVVRLIGYATALVFAAGSYREAERLVLALNRKLLELNRNLDRMVAERTGDLRASEERYALAVRGSTDGLWDWNVVTNEVYYAPRFKELLGFADAEFPNLFSSFESHLHPDDREPTLAAVRAHLSQRAPYDVEYRLRTKSGEYRWFRARGEAIWNPAGEATRMAGSITDITGRKQAETLLEQERFLFRTLLEHLPEPIYFKDAAGRFLRVSTALARRLQAARPEDVLGKTDADFFPAEYAAQARTDEEQLMRTGKALIGKEEHPRWADAHESWVSTTKVPLYDEDGKVIGTFGISHDVTAQKQAEERFRRVIEATPSALVVVNGDGIIQLVNGATERIFGRGRDELVGQAIEILVPAEARDEHVRHREKYFQNPTPRPMASGRSLTACRKDGTKFPVEIGLSPISIGGEILVLSSIMDVTVRKEAERALVQAKEAAEASNRAKSDFLANMSHEIRTPMNAVLGMTELVLESQLDATQREYLTIVMESAESLLAIINEILDFAKIEADRLELQEVDFNLREELGNVMKSLGPRAHAKELELAWHVAPDVPGILSGDPVRLRQVLVNLVGNAIKFTLHGEVVVEVTREAGSPPQPTPGEAAPVMLHFTVRDTGIGIPAEKLAKVFAPFEQADSSTTRQYGGTGLGLSIASRIVAAFGGRIWVDSTVGEGSTFHFTARLRPAETTARPAPELLEMEHMPIVVVDDNATNRRILTEMVQSWGFTVHAAANGPRALEILTELTSTNGNQPVLLTDVNMPDMDGFMLAEKIRSTPLLRRTPIVMLTSGGRPGDIARCETLHVCAHLIKPVKQSELFDALVVALGAHPPPEPSRSRAEPELPPLPPVKVLLAEDGKANQVLTIGLLKKWGHEVVVAENGQEAVDQCRLHKFDVILMDVQMPIMDGLEATERIREMQRGSGERIPILAMTAHAMKGDRERCLRAGMDDYVSKPIRRQELHAALCRFLCPGPAESEASARPAAQLIDWAQARETVLGDEPMLQDVAAVAMRELPELLERLDHACARNDLDAARRAAHTIRGACRVLAAEEVMSAAGAVEEAAASGDPGRLTAALPLLRELTPRLLRELDQFLRPDPRCEGAAASE